MKKDRTATKRQIPLTPPPHPMRTRGARSASVWGPVGGPSPPLRPGLPSPSAWGTLPSVAAATSSHHGDQEFAPGQAEMRDFSAPPIMARSVSGSARTISVAAFEREAIGTTLRPQTANSSRMGSSWSAAPGCGDRGGRPS